MEDTAQFYVFLLRSKLHHIQWGFYLTKSTLHLFWKCSIIYLTVPGQKHIFWKKKKFGTVAMQMSEYTKTAFNWTHLPTSWTQLGLFHWRPFLLKAGGGGSGMLSKLQYFFLLARSTIILRAKFRGILLYLIIITPDIVNICIEGDYKQRVKSC